MESLRRFEDDELARARYAAVDPKAVIVGALFSIPSLLFASFGEIADAIVDALRKAARETPTRPWFVSLCSKHEAPYYDVACNLCRTGQWVMPAPEHPAPAFVSTIVPSDSTAQRRQ